MHLDTLKLVEKLNLPFPWETNARGQIIITPVNYAHSYHVGRLIRVLAGIAPDWESGCQLGIITSDGMKAPDLILAGPAYHARYQGKDGCVTEAPEICIEVMSPSNAWPEMRDKMPLYFEAGAQEVWIVDTDGRISFYASGNEQLPRSRLIPETPRNL